jgi:hypothetical protein
MMKDLMKRRCLAPTRLRVLGLSGLALMISGCSTPVGVKHVDIPTAYSIQNVSALSADQPSEASKTVLRRLGLMDRFDTQPAAVLAELHHGLKPTADEDRLFALAELSFLHGQRTRERAHFLAAAIYAWALLFPGDTAGVQMQPSDPRYRMAYDFYNQGLAQGFGSGGEDAEVRLQPGRYPLPFGSLAVGLEPSGMTWGGYRLDRFVPTTTLEVRGLRNRYRSPGLGAPLAASIANGPASKAIPGS